MTTRSKTKLVAKDVGGFLDAAPDAMVVVSRAGGILAANAHTLTLFGHTAEAHPTASRNTHLILMDIQLPDRDGFRLARRLKRDPAMRDVVIVALTAYAMKGDEQRAVEAGCDGCIAKPIDTRALPARISGYLISRCGMHRKGGLAGCE
jgi:CheY-like chemotaxis protein